MSRLTEDPVEEVLQLLLGTFGPQDDDVLLCLLGNIPRTIGEESGAASLAVFTSPTPMDPC